jgi:hypothetical protein
MSFTNSPQNYVSANGIGAILDANLNAAVQLVPTAAAARAFIGISGMTIMLQGLTAPNDGQGGIFYWVVGNYTDDGTNTIVPSGAIGQGAWTRIGIASLTSQALASPPPIGSLVPNSGAFTSLSASSTVGGAGFTALFAAPPAIGGGTPAAGTFTSLSASGAVGGAGFNAFMASPPAIGGTVAAAGSFTTLSASGQFTSTVTTGTAPMVIASTTNVANLNASSLGGATFASPGSIGNTTPGTGAFTTLSSTGTFTPSQTNGIVGTTTNNNANAGAVGEFVSQNASGSPSTVTITIAAPGVITWTAHGLTTDQPVYFTTTGALPTGLTAGTTYYVVGSSITTNTFEVSATAGGAAITTTGTQSGTQTGNIGASLTTTQAADIAVLALTAGDWVVHANGVLTTSAGCSAFSVWLNQTPATNPGAPHNGGYGALVLSSGTIATGTVQPIGGQRISVASPTLVYLSCAATFGSGSASAQGYAWARRVR